MSIAQGFQRQGCSYVRLRPLSATDPRLPHVPLLRRGSGVTLTGIAPGNYINYGSTGTSGFIVLPEGTYSGATTISIVFGVSASKGYECHGSDITNASPAILVQTYSGALSCHLVKGTAASALDVLSWGTEGPT